MIVVKQLSYRYALRTLNSDRKRLVLISSRRGLPRCTAGYNERPARCIVTHVSFQVRFDPAVLLDWLISPETSFLPYLTLVLRVAVADWPGFAARVSGAFLAAPENDCDLRLPFGTGGEEEEEELVLSDEEAEQLGRTMGCLSGLLASARVLRKNGLVPYDIAPLLKRIGQVVSLYEECGDACREEEQGGDFGGNSMEGVGGDEETAFAVDDIHFSPARRKDKSRQSS